MNNEQLESLYRMLPSLLPNYSPDERSEAFTRMLAQDNERALAEPVKNLAYHAARVRTEEYGVSRREFSAPDSWVAGIVDEWTDEGRDEDMQIVPPVSVDDLALRTLLNSTLERLDDASAQTYILVELRGIDPALAASMLGTYVENVKTIVAGVNGLLRASISRIL